MIDIESRLGEDAARWRRDVDAGARPVLEFHRSVHQRPVALMASAVLVAAAIVTAVLLVLPSGREPVAPAASGTVRQLYGYVWTELDSSQSIVFAPGTADVNDGCIKGLYRSTVNGHRASIGRTIGRQSTCGGTPGGPPPSQLKFDRVVAGTVSWSINGRRLVLSRADGSSITFVRGLPVPSLTNQTWILAGVFDRARPVQKTFRPPTLVIRHGRMRTSDLCNMITARVRNTPSTVTFVGVQTTATRCGVRPDQLPVTSVIDAVLRGSRHFAIRGNELIISGPPGELIYKAS